MGRKKLGNVQITRRITPEAEALLKHLEALEISLDKIIDLAMHIYANTEPEVRDQHRTHHKGCSPINAWTNGHWAHMNQLGELLRKGRGDKRTAQTKLDLDLQDHTTDSTGISAGGWPSQGDIIEIQMKSEWRLAVVTTNTASQIYQFIATTLDTKEEAACSFQSTGPKSGFTPWRHTTTRKENSN